MKTRVLNALIILLIIIFLYSINVFFNNVEALALKDVPKEFRKVRDNIKDVKDTVDDVKDTVKDVKTAMSSVEKSIDKKLSAIEDTTKNLITNKFTSIFTQLGDIFKKGLVDPMISLFTGIGNIFVQIFKILQLIVSKITSLPECIFTYALVSMNDAIYRGYKFITPTLLQNVFSSVYTYTFKIIVDFLTKSLGIDDDIKKCYGFNIKTEMSSINSSLNNINTDFKNDFGKLKFNEIKI
jgi:hypothetical protein